MIDRYASATITETWSDSNKLALWQETELAVMAACVSTKGWPLAAINMVSEILKTNAIDLDWWRDKEAEVGHDLNAFLEERLRFLTLGLQPYFHKKLTSYDTEEPAFAKMLQASVREVESLLEALDKILVDQACQYRYTLMVGRTHGQQAELQSLGKRILTWLRNLRVSWDVLGQAKVRLRYSKLSGAIGNYSGLDPETERIALGLLDLEPFYGATQIMPRELYVPLAKALAQVVQTVDKIAEDIRLGARTPRPICQEPFGKKQKGSSAMPHKKNTIKTEQIAGMANMAVVYASGIQKTISTWEERAIEQSCLERVFWPDLFHVVCHSLKTMGGVISGLAVYPENMLWEIQESRGCYAASEAKEVLKELLLSEGLAAEDAYRIVQLAAFNNQPSPIGQSSNLPGSLEEAEAQFDEFTSVFQTNDGGHLRTRVRDAQLRVSDQLAASQEQVDSWNEALDRVFRDHEARERWDQVFRPTYLLRNEPTLYREIIGL